MHLKVNSLPLSDLTWNSNEIYLAFQSIADNASIIVFPCFRNPECSESQKFSLNPCSVKTWSELI